MLENDAMEQKFGIVLALIQSNRILPTFIKLPDALFCAIREESSFCQNFHHWFFSDLDGVGKYWHMIRCWNICNMIFDDDIWHIIGQRCSNIWQLLVKLNLKGHKQFHSECCLKRWWWQRTYWRFSLMLEILTWQWWSRFDKHLEMIAVGSELQCYNAMLMVK